MMRWRASEVKKKLDESKTLVDEMVENGEDEDKEEIEQRLKTLEVRLAALERPNP